MSNTVTAERNGKRRTFTRKVWDLIGTDKYGWVEVEPGPPPTPKEVEEALTRETAVPSEKPTKRGRRK